MTTNRDTIIRMAAREAGIKNDCDGIWCTADQLARFAALISAAEREACAKVCEESVESDWHNQDNIDTAYECAAAIRARSEDCLK